MIQPKHLKKGDKVAIVCTARSFTPKDAQPAIELLENWGLQVELGKTIGLNNHQLGGTDSERAADLQQMLNRPDIQAIWIARGGYGTIRIIDAIDFSTFQQHPKWIIGFSDITVLHNTLNNLRINSLHAIMPFSVPKATPQAIESLRQALFGETIKYSVPNHPKNKFGTASGELVGGNLSMLYSMLGSPSSLHTHEKILYIEDLDEYLYHIDRMFQNLKRNGYFENLNGLIIGGMTDMHDNQIPFGYTHEEIILDAVKTYDFPVCFDFPAGHIPNNQALILGKNIQLTCNEKHTEISYI